MFANDRRSQVVDRRRSQRELFPYNRKRSQTIAEPTVAYSRLFSYLFLFRMFWKSKQKLMGGGKMTSTCVLFSPVAIIIASKLYSKYYLLTGSLLFKGRSWGADYNCLSHHTAEVLQEQAGWWMGLYPSVSKNYRASTAHGIRTRATSSNLTRVWK